MSILDGFTQTSMVKPQRQVNDEHIDNSGAWAYFDGACQGEPSQCGVGSVIHLNDHRVISFKADIGRGQIIWLSWWL